MRLPSSHSGKRKSYHCHSGSHGRTNSNEETLGAVELHHFEAVFGADLVLHAVQMILDSLFGQGEVIGDFLVGQSLCNQRNKLQFAAAQTQAPAAAGARKAGGIPAEASRSK